MRAASLAWFKRTGVRHSMRHHYSRLFIEMGGRLEELQKSLGHASISITERVYGHLAAESAATLAAAHLP